MSIENIQWDTAEWNSVSQTETIVLPSGATGANAVMVNMGSGDTSVSVSATVNGVAMTKYAHHRHGWFGLGDGNSIVFGLLGSWTGDITVQVTHSSTRDNGRIYAYSAMCTSGNPEFVSYGGQGALNGNFSYSFDCENYEGFGIWNGSHFGTTPGTTTTGTHTYIGTKNCNGATLNFAHTTDLTPVTGVHSGSKGVSTSSTVAYLLLRDSVITARPTAIALPISIPTPVVTGIDFVIAYFASLGLDITIPEPGVVVKPRYTLRLVSEHGDMPGRMPLPSGLSQPIVAYANGEPVWIDLTSHVHPSYRQRRIVMRTGIDNPPEPVSNINGDGWVYMELED
jgi:hypothetical protein